MTAIPHTADPYADKMPDSAGKALLGFAAWTATHIALIVGDRVVRVMLKQRRSHDFGKSRDGSESSFIGRVGKSHANCVENLVLFAAVILTNKAFGGVDLGSMPKYYLMARVAQSLTHWLSVSELAVNTRFSFFLAQCALLVGMASQTYFSI